MADCLRAQTITIKRKESDLMKDEKATTIKARCRKCFNCQATQRREEIQRVSDEAKYWQFVVMITLTYDNKHIRLINFVDEIINKYTKNERAKKLYQAQKIINYIREYKNDNDKKNDNESILKKKIYYNLVNQYSTLNYNDIIKYLNTTKKAIARDKDIKKDKRKFAYYGCGEYPVITENRGRPHYHILFMFNDLKLIKHFINSWYLGNITFKHGDNQINESLSIFNLWGRGYGLTNADYLNCICKQETKKTDIERIYKYIADKKLILETNKNNNLAQVRYIAGYTNKKAEALFISTQRQYYNDISTYYRIKDLIKDIEYKDIRKIMKLRRLQELERRKKGITQEFKEEPFRVKSSGLGKRYAIDNKKRFIDNPTLPTPTMNNISKCKIIPSYYIKKIIEDEVKNGNISEANYILYNKNKIVSKLRTEQLRDWKDYYKKNISYEIKHYYDNTIDIIDTTDNKSNVNIHTLEQRKIQMNELNKRVKEQMFGKKTIKSDTFNKDIEAIRKDLNIYDFDKLELIIDNLK